MFSRILISALTIVTLSNSLFAEEPRSLLAARGLSPEILAELARLNTNLAQHIENDLNRRIDRTANFSRESDTDAFMNLFSKTEFWPNYFETRRKQISSVLSIEDNVDRRRMIDYLVWLSYVDMIAGYHIQTRYADLQPLMWNRFGKQMTKEVHKMVLAAEFTVDSLSMSLINAYENTLSNDQRWVLSEIIVNTSNACNSVLQN